MLGLSFCSKLDWGSWIISIAKTSSKKIGALIRPMKFHPPLRLLFISINLPYGHAWNTVAMSRLHSVHPPVRLGGVGILSFGGRDQNIFDYRALSYERGWVIFLSGKSVHSLVIFSFWNARFQKFKKNLPAAPSFSIFTFSDLKQMQGFK